jgi:hypothetical protein
VSSEVLYRWNGAAWVNITPAANNQAYDVILVDPFDSARVIAIREGGYFNQSQDRGASWDGIIWGPGYAYRQATDIPWLAWTEEDYMSVGDMAFDPAVADKIWFAQGIGVWYTSLQASGVSSVTWISQSAGIEQLVANDIVSPPGGKPVVTARDRPIFYVDDPDVFPSQHGVNNDHSIVMRSIDGGATWSVVPDVLEAYSFGFGKEAPASSYPAIYIAGWVDNVWGIWHSDDEGQNWTQIGEWPLGSLDHIKAVEGDMNTYGVVYVGFSGSGYAYYDVD